jgi:hypothetical protein
MDPQKMEVTSESPAALSDQYTENASAPTRLAGIHVLRGARRRTAKPSVPANDERKIISSSLSIR